MNERTLAFIRLLLALANGAEQVGQIAAADSLGAYAADLLAAHLIVTEVGS